MPTYVYETIPAHDSEAPVLFEVSQRMADKPLERHPDTGVPVRRVVSGGMGILCENRTGGSAAPTTGHSHGCGCH